METGNPPFPPSHAMPCRAVPCVVFRYTQTRLRYQCPRLQSISFLFPLEHLDDLDGRKEFRGTPSLPKLEIQNGQFQPMYSLSSIMYRSIILARFYPSIRGVKYGWEMTNDKLLLLALMISHIQILCPFFKPLHPQRDGWILSPARLYCG